MPLEKSQKVLLFIFVSIVSLFLVSQTATAASTCRDFNLTNLKGGMTDSILNVSDVNNFITYVNNCKTRQLFVILPTDLCYDPVYDFNEDGIINITDLNMLILFVHNHRTGSVFVVNCSTCGC